MDDLSTPFQPRSFVWLPWRRVWYLARVEKIRDTDVQNVELLLHAHGESVTKDKWLTVHRDGTPTPGTPFLRMVQVQPTALTGVGSLPTARDYVQLLVMDRKLADLIASQHTDENTGNLDVPTLVGIVAQVLPARDASLIDVAYPVELEGYTNDEAWQRVQIGNGYVSQLGTCTSFIMLISSWLSVQIKVISEEQFTLLREGLAHAVKTALLVPLEH
ncbi:unnamed protein product [Phytophthora fragariaefolia]|uniref:Unnamed protein product n=1 Tax=Phytophthora fragariaefolia TaxID=1490495 RepID=A0A9W6XCY8_9STRA|nr:unnamed protein product [Phytophthora fragariaefolia]